MIDLRPRRKHHEQQRRDGFEQPSRPSLNLNPTPPTALESKPITRLSQPLLSTDTDNRLSVADQAIPPHSPALTILDNTSMSSAASVFANSEGKGSKEEKTSRCDHLQENFGKYCNHLLHSNDLAQDTRNECPPSANGFSRTIHVATPLRPRQFELPRAHTRQVQ